MKKILLLGTLLGLGMLASAQNYEINIYNNGNRILNMPVSQADSMKFANNMATLSYGTQNWMHSIDAIDSIVFGQIVSPDTIFADTTQIDTANAVRIHWNGTGVDIVNAYASQGVDITATGEDVSIASTISTSDLIYILSGATSDGSLTITSDKKLILYLDGVSITNTDGAAIKMASDKRVMLHMAAGTTSTLCDGTANTEKGTIAMKGKLDLQGSGTLNVSGLAKHAIQSSGKCNMMGGTVNVLTAVKDGLNVDDFVMDGGSLNVISLGDGIDGDKGMIEINNGSIVVNCSAADSKGIGCDSTLTINGGIISVTMSGDQSKCLKSKQSISINNGTIELNANGTLVLEAIENGYDPSFCTGIKADGNVAISGGTTTINCAAANAGGRGISSDANITINSGNLTITALGGSGVYTNAEGATDDYSSACINADSNVVVNGGKIILSAGGKGITCDQDFILNGGDIDISTSGNGAVTVGSGTNATEGYASACVKADRSLLLNSGRLNGSSTGIGGRGLVGSHLVMGTLGAEDDLIDIDIRTSGAPVNATSGGGWGGGHPGGSTSDYWKGLPKGVKMDSSITINSGHLSVYCSQTSGDPTGEAIESKGSITINGGEVEANSYDDAINAAQSIIINGGKVWAYARGNDGIDCNGTSVTINGGLVIVQGTEVGIDADTENGGRFNIVGGTIVCKGGNMGCWDTPTCTGTQRYITASVTPTTGFAIADQNDNILLVFKAPQVTGSGFIDQSNGTGTKPPGGGGGSNSGMGITIPGMVQGSYKVYSNVTISGGEMWHGYYTGANCTTNGSATTVTTR